MFTVGLTGGIGSGKSTVADRFAQLGVNIIDADVAARTVVQPGTRALGEIAQHFGADFITAEGELNRSKLRERVFHDPEARKWLEQLLHPLVRKLLEHQLQSAKGAYCLLVSPLLLETGQKELVNRVLVVDVNEEQQLQRTIARDGSSTDTVQAIIAAQLPRARRLELADDVIDNSGEIDTLTAQVKKLHKSYLELSSADVES